MKLIEDLGKRKDSKNRNRRYGVFHCKYCNQNVERRIDTGTVADSCGCMKRRDAHSKFETWRCTRCHEVKPLTDYYKREDTKSYRRECKTCVKEKTLLRKFGVDYTWYHNKLEEQNHCCAICKKPLESKRNDKFDVDHCHTTGNVRGLLCTTCNTGIGLLKEDITIFKNAEKYLNKYKEDIV